MAQEVSFPAWEQIEQRPGLVLEKIHRACFALAQFACMDDQSETRAPRAIRGDFMLRWGSMIAVVYMCRIRKLYNITMALDCLRIAYPQMLLSCMRSLFADRRLARSSC